MPDPVAGAEVEDEEDTLEASSTSSGEELHRNNEKLLAEDPLPQADDHMEGKETKIEPTNDCISQTSRLIREEIGTSFDENLQNPENHVTTEILRKRVKGLSYRKAPKRHSRDLNSIDNKSNEDDLTKVELSVKRENRENIFGPTVTREIYVKNIETAERDHKKEKQLGEQARKRQHDELESKKSLEIAESRKKAEATKKETENKLIKQKIEEEIVAKKFEEEEIKNRIAEAQLTERLLKEEKKQKLRAVFAEKSQEKIEEEKIKLDLEAKRMEKESDLISRTIKVEERTHNEAEITKMREQEAKRKQGIKSELAEQDEDNILVSEEVVTSDTKYQNEAAENICFEKQETKSREEISEKKRESSTIVKPISNPIRIKFKIKTSSQDNAKNIDSTKTVEPKTIKINKKNVAFGNMQREVRPIEEACTKVTMEEKEIENKIPANCSKAVSSDIRDAGLLNRFAENTSQKLTLLLLFVMFILVLLLIFL